MCLPDGCNGALANAGVKGRIDSNTGHENQRISAEQERQPVAVAGWDVRFLQKILQAATRPPRIGLQAFAAAADANGDLVTVELVDADAATPASLHDECAAELRQTQRCLSPPDPREL